MPCRVAKSTLKQITPKMRSFFHRSYRFISVATTPRVTKEKVMTGREWMKMISGRPKTRAKIWKGGERCTRVYMQLLNSLMDAQLHTAHWCCCCIRRWWWKKFQCCSTRLSWANDQHGDVIYGQLNLVMESFNSTFPEPAYWWNRGIKEQLKISDYKRPCIRILGIVEDNMGRVNPSRDEGEGEG